jgi:pilus assembly protein CpaB
MGTAKHPTEQREVSSMKRSLIAAIVAVVLAGIGCAAVLLYVNGAKQRALVGVEAVNVVLATKRIPSGTTGARIRDGGYVEIVAMPKSSVPADAMSEIDKSLDKLAVTSDLQPRQLLLRGAFDEPSRVTGGLALPEGKLAVSVAMAAPEQVAGYVRPGSKIVIFDSFTAVDSRTPIPSGERLTFGKDIPQTTRILLPRVEVIAVGTRGEVGGATSTSTSQPAAGTATGGAAAAVGASNLVVTVAVTQDEAERLVHAVQTGTLYLALLDDSTDVRPDLGVTNQSLFS